MKKLLSGFLFVAFIGTNTAHAQITPSIEWQKCLGGSWFEDASSIAQTKDGGFIMAGGSTFIDGDVTGNHGTIDYYGDSVPTGDYWIVRLDIAGNIVWQKSLGGSDGEMTTSIQQTSDGGFVAAGHSHSNDGDVTGNHGSEDYWIVKLDTSGNMEWQKSLGGSDYDDAYSIQQTTDGGFIVAGVTVSNDGDVSGNHGLKECWVVKLDTDGNLAWQKTLGGSLDDAAVSVQQTSDGGFVVAGSTNSNDGDVSGWHEGYQFGQYPTEDYWIVKLNMSGNIEWQKCLGGSNGDGGSYIQEIKGVGFIVAGTSSSNDGDVSGNHRIIDYWGDSITTPDYWIVKLDTVGNLVWQKSLGGSGDDEAGIVQQSADGGFIVAGFSESSDGDITGNHGVYDYWVVKLDASSNLLWQKSLGGSVYDLNFAGLDVTFDGGCILAGGSSSIDGDVTGSHGFEDCWIVKLKMDTVTGTASLPNNSITVYPNPVQTQLNVNLVTPVGEVIIRVYDLQGRMIVLPTTFTNTQAQLNTTALADGFYTLQIINNKTGKSEKRKFVKQ